jgi:dienelactone hydrolase
MKNIQKMGSVQLRLVGIGLVFGALTAFANPGLLRLHRNMDVNQDGAVTEAEFFGFWQADYHRRDKDNDGMLASAEVAAAVLRLADRNNDGVLTWAEERRLRQVHFQRMDKDVNKGLSVDEMVGTASGSNRSSAATGALGLAEARSAVEALASLTAVPEMQLAEGYDSSDDLAAIYYNGLDWKGQPTKVFAWLGYPAQREGKVPAVVLVHGGGGTAFKQWVQEWNARGYAAISIAVEGQLDRAAINRPSQRWQRHQWPGPERNGIYHDSAQPIRDQWMYHAVADTILANSLLRSLPKVDADRVGLMGISWGGVITSTVIGLDPRFAFAIPTYGCGDLATAENIYGKSLRNNEIYKQVWDPMLRLQRAAMPTLWFSWPEDAHFPMDRFAASYKQAAGTRMVSLVPEMGHGHGPGWVRPESYVFADSVLSAQGPWCVQLEQSLQAGLFQVTFRSTKTLQGAVLVSTTDGGVSSERTWVESPAELSKSEAGWVASAKLPAGTTAWFVNVQSDGLIASSDYQEVQ